MADTEYDKRLGQIRARWDALRPAPANDDDCDPDQAFAEFFDDVAGWDLETAEFFLTHGQLKLG